MRRILGIAMAVALGGPALAADLYQAPVKTPAYAPPLFTWTGTYVGANLGYAWGTFDFNPVATNNITGAVSTPGSASVSVSNNNVIGGFQAGYNWQVGQWVLGVEQDFQFTGVKQGFTFAAPVGPFLPGDSLSAKTDYLSGTRARVGLAWDRLLVYAAGGLETAMLDVTSTYVTRGAGGSPALAFTDTNKYHFGYNIGAGIDYAVTNNVFIGVEYRYFNVGNETYSLGAFTPAGSAAQTVSSQVELKASEVVARLNLKLNGLGLFGL
jgi:outer membrane immunogenic protein